LLVFHAFIYPLSYASIPSTVHQALSASTWMVIVHPLGILFPGWQVTIRWCH